MPDAPLRPVLLPMIVRVGVALPSAPAANTDRKSTRLNSSHSQISYAVFCLKKKKYVNTKSSSKARSSEFPHNGDRTEMKTAMRCNILNHTIIVIQIETLLNSVTILYSNYHT